MEEVYQGIFKQTIKYPGQDMFARNLLVVRQPGRSLMVDTAMDLPQDRRFAEEMLAELGIDYRDLDIFITHDHPDHTGLAPLFASRGARILMNPDETRRRADLWHCYLSDARTRQESFRIVGVTPELTPDVYDTMMEYTERAHSQVGPAIEFNFVPVRPGRVLRYGDFRFQVISLKGHTNGQCGLYEPDKKLLFCGDQIMTTIVPIVSTQYKDWGMLKSYLESLTELRDRYGDCRFLTAHYGEIEDVGKEVERIVLGYMDKCTIMRKVLAEGGRPMTTRDVGVRAYGRSMGPPDYKHFMSCTHIWAKTFSCLEYMYGEGLIKRTEKDGVLYWSV